MTEPTLESIRQAHERIRGHVRRTPVLTSGRLDSLCGARLVFKCENFQKTGAFKARGALNAVLSLPDAEAARGVATHSSGNHAAALAWAAALRGIPATVVMPRTASPFKLAAVGRYGARIVLCEPTHRAREEAADRVVAETGAALVHPFDDPRVIAGQATAALELLEDAPELDAVACPVGGGGLLCGTAVVARALRPGIRVLAGEPEGAADASRSLASGRRSPVDAPASVADGLLATVGVLTFPVIRREVEAIATVSDDEIRDAVRRLLEVMKIAVEPSGAVAYAAVASGRLRVSGARVGVILSGGNLDLERAPWLKQA
jgi:threonine dehydratase